AAAGGGQGKALPSSRSRAHPLGPARRMVHYAAGWRRVDGMGQARPAGSNRHDLHGDQPRQLNPEPTNEPARRLMHSRYIKTHRSISPELEEKIAPKYGTAREMDRRDQVWIEHAAELTEEALDRQMRPARQLRWEDMTPLPDDLERAFDQFATYLIQAMYLCSDASGPWNGLIHYGFAEVKSFLAYELFDYNLMCGLLRKRVMANGGGFGGQIERLGAGLIEVCNESSHGFVGEVDREFAAVVFAIDILFNSILLGMAQLAQAAARSRFDRHLMTQLIQDSARHVAFGCRRISFYLRNCSDRE